MNPFIKIYNNHHRSCGKPAFFSNKKYDYVGYFENIHGEQWVFTYDAKTDTAVLYGGDVDWDNPRVVEEGTRLWVMDNDEAQWLIACWSASRWIREKSRDDLVAKEKMEGGE